MGTLEKQLEEEKQRVQTAESQRGAGTGKHQWALRVVVLRTQQTKIFHALFGVLVEATVPPVPLQLPWVTWKDCLVAQLV